MSAGFRIERIGPADWGRFVPLRLEALRTEPTAYGSTYDREVAFDPSVWQDRLGENDTFLAYAERSVSGGDEDRPVGTATGLRRGEGTTMVVAMYVRPAFRGRRCAWLLLDAVAAAARAAGQHRLVLGVTEAGSPAARSYRAYGFTPTGRSTPLDRDPLGCEIEFALELD